MLKRQTSTKEDIKQALIILLQEKGFDAITVSDLTRRANINRGTFYLHYLDKFDLMDKLVQVVFDNILQHLKNADTDNPIEVLVSIFEDIKADFNFIAVLSYYRFDYVNRLLKDFLMVLFDTIPAIQKRVMTQTHLPLDYAKEVFLSSNAGIIFHWIKKGGIETSQEIAEIFMANNI